MSSKPRALVVKLSSLGDLFHALPAVHRLKQELDCAVDWVTQSEYVGLVKCFTDVDRVIPFPRRSFVRSFKSFSRELRRDQYEYVFDFQGLLKSALTARLARASERIGPSYAREGAPMFYTALAGATNKDRHAVDEALDFVRYFNFTPGPVTFPVSFPVVGLEGDHPRIAYAPCSRWTTKNWPPESFSACIDLIHGQVGGSAFIIGGSGDHAVGEKIRSACAVPLVNRCGQTSLVELGGFFRAIDLLVTVDSGPMHMAAALGVPVLAVFGATDPSRTGPYGDAHRVIQNSDLPCVPCRSRQCKRPERDVACLTELSPTVVASAAVEMVKGYCTKH